MRNTLTLRVALACIVALGIGAGDVMAQKAPGPSAAKNAKKGAVQGWPLEPSAFMGLELGKSLAEQEAVLVACPEVPVWPGAHSTVRDPAFKGFCYTGKLGATERLSVFNPPDLGFWFDMKLITQGDVFQGVSLVVNEADRAAMGSVLVQKYGPPTSRELKTYQNALGATFEGSVLTWSGDNVMLQYEELGPTRKLASMLLLSKEHARAKGNGLINKAGAAAGKL